MKKIFIYIVVNCILLLSIRAEAAFIMLSRDSSISGNGTYMSNQSVETTNLYANFNQTLSDSQHTNGYNEDYSISQQSVITSTGFSLDTSFSASALNGEFAWASTQSYFDIFFYVNEPSILTLTGIYNNIGSVGTISITPSSRNEVNIGADSIWTQNNGLPFTTTLYPTGSFGQNIAYQLVLGNLGANISPFRSSSDPSQSSGFIQLTATVQPIATPIPYAIWLVGSALAGLVGFARRKLPL